MLAHAYEYMITVARYGSLTQAARALFITQPALTKYLNRLEKELDVKLLDRTQTPIQLTPAGKIFIKKAHSILSLQNDLLQELHNSASMAPQHIRLGMTPEACSLNLPYILLACRRKFPNLKISVLEGQYHLLKEKLATRSIDFALMAQADGRDTADYHLEFLENEPILVALPQSHPLCQELDLTNNSPLSPYFLPPEKLNGVDFVLCQDSLGIGHTARLIFQKHRIKPHIVMGTARNETALRLASTGLGAAVVPIRTPLRISLIYPMAYFSIQKPLITRTRWIYALKEPLDPFKTEFLHFVQRLYKEQAEMTVPACQLLSI